MAAISVRSLVKTFNVPVKRPGLWGAVRSALSRKTREIPAVRGVSFAIEKGELVGFLGENGAGKTTTLKLLSGLLTPTSGEAWALGHLPWKREPEFQRKMALVMGQRSQLWWELPPLETFRLNAAIYGLPETQFKRHLAELVDLLDLSQCLDVPVKRLSLGQRMRSELACALLHRPSLLLLDEPTLGLDVIMQKQVREFLKEYNRSSQTTILLTSHNMEDIRELCPRVLVIEKGSLVYDGALARLTRDYAESKVIRLVFSEEIPAERLRRLEAAAIFDAGRILGAVVEVPRERVAAAAARILRELPVQDLTIEEPDVGEIVRRIFRGRRAAAATRAP